jgi:hypothetical protein
MTLTLPYRIKVKFTHYNFFEFGRMCQKSVSEFVGAATVHQPEVIFFEICSIHWRKSSIISSFNGGLPSLSSFSTLPVATNLSIIVLMCGIKFAFTMLSFGNFAKNYSLQACIE